MVVAIWVLDKLAVISEVVATGVAAVVGSDMAVAQGGTGCDTRDWGVCWSAEGWLGSECRHLQGAGGCFEARDEVVGAVVNSVIPSSYPSPSSSFIYSLGRYVVH